ncbi:hypothetical protein DSO57_1024066 [Entomophthora muscae]|uniref:Uncharacterized protein n=1 Tax=Entomophthora muscae TaxID=34485 RepID=A0ACC2RTP4_9FUNG|nr:hypothetical protein DSO57_1024066 [Entomophthora muscae]
MVFTSNVFGGTRNQASSSQASFNEADAQIVEAPIYTQAFDAALPPLPYPPLHKLPTNLQIRMATVGFLVISPQSVSWVIARDQLGGVAIS